MYGDNRSRREILVSAHAKLVGVLIMISSDFDGDSQLCATLGYLTK